MSSLSRAKRAPRRRHGSGVTVFRGITRLRPTGQRGGYYTSSAQEAAQIIAGFGEAEEARGAEEDGQADKARDGEAGQGGKKGDADLADDEPVHQPGRSPAGDRGHGQLPGIPRERPELQ